MLQAGLWAVVTTSYWLGQFEVSIEYADLILERYDRVRDHGLADALNHDPKTVALQYKAASLGRLGYPDSALELMQAAVEHARGRGHAFDLAWAYFFATAQLHCAQGDISAADARLADLETLARDQRLLAFEYLLAPYCRAVCDLLEGSTKHANDKLNELIPIVLTGGAEGLAPEAKAWHAQCAIALREPQRALELADQALAMILQPAAEMRYIYPEVLRVKGLALEALRRLGEAEAVLQDAISTARTQRAKWSELRAGATLARLWASHGKRRQARELLLPIYDWFTEGSDTSDLKEAKALLETLEAGA
jgi:tetratricopeptide (TPR) repeat protein